VPKNIVIEERMTSPIQSFARLSDDELLASANLSAWCEQIVQGRFSEGVDGRPVTQDNCERLMEHDGAGGAPSSQESAIAACTYTTSARYQVRRTDFRRLPYAIQKDAPTILRQTF
jgi:hypothetical protein